MPSFTCIEPLIHLLSVNPSLYLRSKFSYSLPFYTSLTTIALLILRDELNLKLTAAAAILPACFLRHCKQHKMSSQTRTLGRNGPTVSAVGLGCGSLAGFYGGAGDLNQKVALLDHAHKIGLRFWDAADVYGDVEDIIGEWVKRNPTKRKDITIATKFGLKIKEGERGGHDFDSSPEWVREACERSLKRLNTDCIDVYYCHRVDGKTPIEKTVEAMVDLKR